ncbi:MAG TPA: glycosyltransferase family 9 protein [Candidatus Sulfotelmatobacter sp.]|jgi:tetratricopeptide (TPR) repeat protein|nr:glycosyltransferase family 9 protein [Candidatus Sulfotelmatobacter sp.]
MTANRRPAANSDLILDFPGEAATVAEFHRAHAALDAQNFSTCADICQKLQADGNRHPVLDYMLGVSLFQLGNREVGTAMIGKAAQSQPDNLLLRIDHANSLATIGLMPVAIQTLIDGIKIHGPHPDIALRLSRFFTDTGQHHKAQLLLVSAISANPSRVDLCCLLAAELAAELKANEAITLMELSGFLCGEHPGITSSLAVLEQARGNLDQAIVHYEKTLELDPEHALSHANLSTALLTRNEFQRSFAEAEWRLQTQNMRVADVPAPRWTGQPLAGKRLLITGEQGFGDMIQYSRFLSRLPADGAHVTLEIHDGLQRLFKSLPHVADIVTITEEENFPPCDYTIPMVSLPLVVGCDADWLRASVPYLPTPAPMKLKAPGKAMKVGLAWASRPSTGEIFARRMLNRRSCPLEQLAPLTEVEGTAFFSLQKGDAALHLQEMPLPVTDLSPRLGDFLDTAAAIAALDLVITVDTSVAHLAGAMGKPVWIMLSAGQIDYRWGNEEETLWYPHARLYRAGAGGWTGILRQIGKDLDAAVKGGFPLRRL